jgi:hypothetical protein
MDPSTFASPDMGYRGLARDEHGLEVDLESKARFGHTLSFIL